MCGHVGIAGDLAFKDEKTMKRLLILDYFRGPDSTGLASIRPDGDVKIAKLASHPIDLFDTKSFVDALSGFNSDVFIGHNRLATKGKVNGNNAHPYVYGHIIGAHNGTLDKSAWDDLNKIIGYETDVDSQAIFAAIEKVGIEETIKVMRGAWALVWYDLHEGTLNFLRNKERPFWYSYEKGFKRLFWASEWPMIDAAVQMGGTDYELFESTEGHRFWATAENWLYRWDIEELKKGSTLRPKPRVKELKGKEPCAAVTYHCGNDPFSHSHHSSTTQSHTSMKTVHGSTTSSSSSTEKESDVQNVIGFRHNPFGGKLTRDRFEEIAKYGCSWCEATVNWNDVGVTVYEDRHIVMCPDCSGNGNHSRLYLPKTA